jgi:citrate synthase
LKYDRGMAVAEKGKAGLEDVVATSSAICYLDGERGVLAYCGYDIHDLAKQATFEEVCYLLWHRRLPSRAELGDLQSQLAAARALPEPLIRLMRSLPPADGMDALRTLTSALGHYDAEANDAAPQAQYRKAVRLTAQIGSIVATWGRLQAGGGPIAPDPAMGHAANFLYMLTGERPSAVATRAFDIALTLHADHELNASTFAGRVAAATLTDIYSAVVAAIGTLKGPLHGGANIEVMKVLLELGATASGDRIDEFVRGKFARKEKIPGFGHRVYKTEDPRATHLRQMSKEIGKKAGQPHWYDMSQRIEALVKAEKKLHANVDFYSASMYYTLGIPFDLYTPIFAVSRISGWTAHILEQYANNRLIRPRADYIGPEYPQRIVPIEQR